jgi:UDPglucose 6-dehydrogenase
LAVLTEWDEFTWLDFDKLAELMVGRNIVDGRNLLEPSIPQRRGFNYRGVGR